MSKVLSKVLIKNQDAGFSFGSVDVHKYRKNVFYKGDWCEETINSRGHVYDKDGSLVALPFRKTFNYGVESQADPFELDEAVYIYKKINGFMVAVSMHKGELVVSTTGSVVSKFVDYAKEFIKEDEWVEFFIDRGLEDYTFIFECVHPDDPHIISHEVGLYFLGARYKFKEEYLLNSVSLNIPVTEFVNEFEQNIIKFFVKHNIRWDSGKLTTLSEAIKEVETVDHEGFMVYSVDFHRCVKLKSPYYLCKKLVMRAKSIEGIKQRYLSIAKGTEYELVFNDFIEPYAVSFLSVGEQERGDMFDFNLRLLRM